MWEWRTSRIYALTISKTPTAWRTGIDIGKLVHTDASFQMPDVLNVPDLFRAKRNIINYVYYSVIHKLMQQPIKFIDLF